MSLSTPEAPSAKATLVIPPPAPRRRLKWLAIGLLVLLLLGVLGWLGYRKLRAPAADKTHWIVATVGIVETKVTETGAIEPLKKVEVKSKVGGRVTALYAQEGASVTAGQLLATIEPTEINSQVAQIRAQLDGVRARYDRAVRTVPYQSDQTRSSITSAREALRQAESRLKVAREESDSQPQLTRSSVAQAQAGLDTARDALALLKNSTQPQAEVQAQSGFDDTQANVNALTRDLQRQRNLLAKGYVAGQDVETAEASLASAIARRDQAKKRLDVLGEQHRLEVADAESRVRQAQAALNSARAGASAVPIKRHGVDSAVAAVKAARAQLLGATSGTRQDQMRQDDVAEAKASVVQLENQLREVEVRQKDTRILAPQSGVVTRRYMEAGELISSGVNSFSAGTPVMQIADLSQMLVKISVNEVDVHKIRPALPVDITIDGAKGAVFTGHVRKVAPAAVAADQGAQNNNGVIRFAVEVLVDHPDSRLKPGMSAKCALIVARKPNVLRLPLNAVKGTGSKTKVDLPTGALDEKGAPKTVERPITVGLRGDTYLEVLSGLKKGEKVKPQPFTGPPRKAIEMNF